MFTYIIAFISISRQAGGRIKYAHLFCSGVLLFARCCHQIRQLTQALLDSRKTLSSAGWCVQDSALDTAHEATGTAVKAGTPSAAAAAAGGAAGGADDQVVPDHVILMLMHREGLLARAQLGALQLVHEKAGGTLQEWERVIEEASAESMPGA
jgi:hypothetical protein